MQAVPARHGWRWSRTRGEPGSDQSGYMSAQSQRGLRDNPKSYYGALPLRLVNDS
jgi:hypothetical protein